MEDLSKSWMVTFFYEQELRSYYMNGVLNGLISPGIHNANLSIYTVDNVNDIDSGKQSSGIYLHIRKGSTFVFSNNYKLNEEGKIVKDLDSLGNYLIKCVALKDITYDLYRWDKNFVLSDNVANFLGQNRSLSYYVIASLVYNANQGTGVPGAESGATKFLAPKFTIVKSNSDYNTEIENPDLKQSLYFKCPEIQANDIKKELRDGVGLPDGSKDYFGNKSTSMDHLSWLMVGTIAETAQNKVDHPSYYVSNNWGEGAAEEWTQQHVFFGRGLPEYRKSFVNTFDNTSPDFILGPKLENFYMDLGTIFDENIIYEEHSNWNKVNSIAAEINPETGYPKIPYTGHEDYSFVIPDQEFKKIYQEVFNNSKFPLKHEEVGSHLAYKDFLIADVVFLNAPKHSSNMKIDLENLFSTSQTSLIDEKNSLPIKGIRFVANPGSYNFNPAYDSEDQKGSDHITHRGYSYDGALLENKDIVPFDVCVANLSRLQSIISNKSFLPALIDTLRRENLISAKDSDTLIPICMAFRKFKVTQLSDGSFLTPISADGFSTREKVHPCNILSFFDIQNNSTQAHAINLKANEAYTVLPVID